MLTCAWSSGESLYLEVSFNNVFRSCTKSSFDAATSQSADFDIFLLFFLALLRHFLTALLLLFRACRHLDHAWLNSSSVAKSFRCGSLRMLGRFALREAPLD